MNSNPLIIRLLDIETLISKSDDFAPKLLSALSDGFASLVTKPTSFHACPIQTLGAPPPTSIPFFSQDYLLTHFNDVNNEDPYKAYSAQTCIKTGYFQNSPYFVIKIASGGFPFPANTGCMQLFSTTTGSLMAILLDEGILTEIRTAALGALSFALLAPKITTLPVHYSKEYPKEYAIGVLGTGVQAKFQLQWLSHVTTCRLVYVYGRNSEHAKSFQKYFSRNDDNNWEVRIVDHPNQLLQLCNYIITTTSAREAVLGKEMSMTDLQTLKQHINKNGGLHITCIGSDAPGKMELEPQLIAMADLLVADVIPQSVERGEYQSVVKNGLVQQGDIHSISEVILDQENKLKHVTPDENVKEDGRFTIFDSSGVALQDCIIARLTYEAFMSDKNS